MSWAGLDQSLRYDQICGVGVVWLVPMWMIIELHHCIFERMHGISEYNLMI